MESRSQEWRDGYRQAVLDAARCLCLCDHVGDARDSMGFLWRAAGLAGDGLPQAETGVDLDQDRLEAMGARECYEVEDLDRGQETKLLDIVACSLTSWPHMDASDVVDDLAAALGVTIQRSQDNDRARIDPDSLPSWYRNDYEQEGIEW